MSSPQLFAPDNGSHPHWLGVDDDDQNNHDDYDGGDGDDNGDDSLAVALCPMSCPPRPIDLLPPQLRFFILDDSAQKYDHTESIVPPLFCPRVQTCALFSAVRWDKELSGCLGWRDSVFI